MREIKAKRINNSDFSKFGTFYHMEEPDGYPLCGEIHTFYPDRLTGVSIGNLGFSPLIVRKDDRIIRCVEYHNTTWEGIIPLNDDMIIHVAPPSAGCYPFEYTEAFVVPRGCMVKINTAIWHLAPLPVNQEELHAIIVLPECTYVNDCHVVELDETDWFKIIL